MRLLFLSPRQCWPPQSGAKLREYHLLRALGQQADVDYAYFLDPAMPAPEPATFAFCSSVTGIPKPAMYRPGQVARGLLGPWPLPVVNYTAASMATALQELSRDSSFDLIHLDSIHMVRYPGMLSTSSQARVVYNWHNIESEAMQRFGQTVSSPSKRLYANLTARKLRALERRILREAFGHIVCSERERQQLLALAPGARIAVVENGVDCAAFAETPAAASSGSTNAPLFVFVGSMDYYPNIDAALSFAQETWPLVRQHLPEAQLQIVGARPTAAVSALGKIEGITVTGTVPDVRPYYHGATASIVPLRTGGGTRLKILESMAAGVPVVSTTLGAEGLAVTPGKDILIAESGEPLRWVECLEMLAQSSSQAAALGQAGLQLVRQRYDWPILGAELVRTYTRWLHERE